MRKPHSHFKKLSKKSANSKTKGFNRLMMNKILSFLLLFPFAVCAQTNTFPSSGNVGIGTTSPNKKFEINTANGVADGIRIGYGAATNEGLDLLYLNSAASSVYIDSRYNSDAAAMYFRMKTASTPVTAMTILGNGNIGIGTISPSAKLDIAGQMNIGATGTAGKIYFARPGDGNYQGSLGWESDEILRQYFSGGSTSYRIASYYNNQVTDFLTVTNTGNVAIGTTDAQGYKLAVNGDAIFAKIKVKAYSSWPDYVFHSSYKLRPLKDLEAYIKQNNHLPDVPSAEDVEKNGLDLSDNQATLLKKIEELTMYIIDLDKKVSKITEENETLKKKLNLSNN